MKKVIHINVKNSEVDAFKKALYEMDAVFKNPFTVMQEQVGKGTNITTIVVSYEHDDLILYELGRFVQKHYTKEVLGEWIDDILELR